MAKYISINNKTNNKTVSSLDPLTFKLAKPGLHVFTTFVTHLLDENKRIGILRPEYHLERIINGSIQLGIKTQLTDKNYSNWFTNLLYNLILEESNIKQKKIRIIQRESGELEIQIEEYQNPWGDSIKLKTYCSTRTIPEVKHTDVKISTKAREFAENNGAEEALLIDQDSYVLEGAWSNIFWFDQQNRLHTTEQNVLPGITRKIIFELEDVRISKIKLDQLLQAKEIFITQSTSGITSVSEIDNQKISVGENTKNVKQKFDKYISLNAESINSLSS